MLAGMNCAPFVKFVGLLHRQSSALGGATSLVGQVLT